LFSLERLNFQTPAGKAKVLGTLTGIGGAMLLTFLKGVEINLWTFHINLLHKGNNGTLNDNSGSKLLGIFFGLGSCFCFALWLIIQVKIIKITCFSYNIEFIGFNYKETTTFDLIVNHMTI